MYVLHRIKSAVLSSTEELTTFSFNLTHTLKSYVNGIVENRMRVYSKSCISNLVTVSLNIKKKKKRIPRPGIEPIKAKR